MLITLGAQTPYSYHLTVADGLPSNKVYSVIQDHKGFIWFATDNGIARYDGTRITKYNVKHGLPDNDAFYIFEDWKNRLWVICFKQAPCFFLNDTIHTIQNDSFLKAHFNKNISYKFLINHKLKRILFYTGIKDKIALIEYGKVKMLNFTYVPSSDYQLFQHGNTDYLFVNDGIINLNNRKQQHFDSSWFGCSVDQFCLHGRDYAVGFNYTFMHVFLAEPSGDTLRKLLKIKAPTMLGPYINGNQPPAFLDISDGRIITYDWNNKILVPTNRVVPDAHITTGYMDNAGNFWAGTYNNGVYMLPGKSAEIFETMNDKTTVCFSRDNQRIFCGTENRHIYIIDKKDKIIQKEVPPDWFRTHRILGVCVIGKYLYTGGDLSLAKYNIETGIYKPINIKGYLYQTIKDLELAPDGNLLIASGNGAIIFSPKTDKTLDTIWTQRTIAIQSDKKGTVYLGTINGLFRYSRALASPQRWVTGNEVDKSRITDIRLDGKGRLWIGTSQYGLFIYDGKKWQNLSDNAKNNFSQKLTSYYVKNIYMDEKGIAWISTDKGLNRVEYLPSGTPSVHRITKSIGLPDDNLSASIVSGDTVYVATSSGIARFVYSTGMFSEFPGLEFTGFRVNFKNAALRPFTELTYTQNNISIEFAGIAIRGASNLIYKYRLLGSDNSWLFTENNQVDLLSLAPGNYRFEVQAINLITGENSPTRFITFNITPAWYKTYTFIAAIILFFAALATMVIYMRIKRLRKESENKISVNKRMAELEMQALRAQMNPHFIFNALTAIQNFYVNQKEIEGNLYMSRFASLIRRSLDLSRDNMIRLDEEIAFLENYMELEIMRFQGKLTFHCMVEPNLDTASLFIPTMMLQPILENAVNHGIRPSLEAGLVELKFYLHEGDLVCEVRDNGIGINRSEEIKRNGFSSHKSKGIHILRSRIHNIEAILQTKIGYEVADLSNDTKKSSGTSVKIFFGKDVISEQTI